MLWGRDGIAGLPRTRAAVLEFRRETCFVTWRQLSEVSPTMEKYESV